MAGLSPKLPLMISPIDKFYRLNRTMKEVVTQNLKMLVLTAPGERIMDPNFGVGVRNYLFENTQLPGIERRIRDQVKKYMSYLNIIDIKIAYLGDEHTVGLMIAYAAPSLKIQDFIQISQTTI
jgi:hypothetical protein